jgi:hypothetical protein
MLTAFGAKFDPEFIASIGEDRTNIRELHLTFAELPAPEMALSAFVTESPLSIWLH